MRILVVDDDPTIVELLRLNFELEGHEVLVATDGERALESVRTRHPDVVLLDVMMPGIDGFTVCERIRSGSDTERLPVVFVSARAQEADLERGRQAGCEAYVTKPFDPIELLELVEGLADAEHGSNDGRERA